MTKHRLARTFWVGAAAILVVAALVAIVALVRGEFSDTDGRILATLGALLYTGGAALSGLALVDRGTQRALGWLVAAASPVCLGIVLWAIWRFTFDGDGDAAPKLGWSAVLALAAGLIATTGLLLARRPLLVGLAALAGGLAALAATLSIVGIWTLPDSETFVKALAVAWVLAALAYFLVPVLQRFTAAGEEEQAERVLAELEGVELVATRSREGTIDPRLATGERLLLRRRT